MTELPRPIAIDSLLGLPKERKLVAVVSCGRQKSQAADQAQYLYTSSLFRNNLLLARELSAKQFIMSAHHGLLLPNQVIEPYDVALSNLPLEARIEWGERVAAQLIQRTEGRIIVSLAGMGYNRFIDPALHACGRELISPFSGLGLGRRQAFAKRLTRIYRRFAAAKTCMLPCDRLTATEIGCLFEHI
ncbi:DUF6884 domain-containing protein [uncultured Enterovirga sp.]|uniref:DUF6884 domain-containing protein n=1 Tax=uncultured Enterovirga sp. TaxID=2026352 RepID=UPI0035CBBD8D